MKKPVSDRKIRKKRRALRRVRQRKFHCPHCGGRGPHFVHTTKGDSKALGDIALGSEARGGFWTCPIYFGPDKRRMADHDVVFPAGYPKDGDGG